MGRPRVYSLDDRREFWRLWMAGFNPVQISRLLPVSKSLGYRWVSEAGGMPPPDVKKNPGSGRYLSLAERIEIGQLQAEGLSIRKIAGRLGRSPSTVSRELHRHRVIGPNAYRPLIAHHRAENNARRPKPRRLHQPGQLRCLVQAMLRKKMSPEQISGRLEVLFGDDTSMRVSPETVYQAIYVQGRGSLRRELAQCLRTGRAMRKPKQRRDHEERRGRIPDMVNISERPAEANDRAIPGHWEGDLIVGRNNKSAIGTLVERSTRFVMLLHLPDDHSAIAVRDEMVRAVERMPESLRRTVTWDQGREMSRHLEITMATNMGIYFCDPHSPWQRGSNENTNGLLRQYFPKGTDLSVHSRDYLNEVANEMNDRPRKTLGFHTPKERLTELLSNPPEIPADATTT